MPCGHHLLARFSTAATRTADEVERSLAGNQVSDGSRVKAVQRHVGRGFNMNFSKFSRGANIDEPERFFLAEKVGEVLGRDSCDHERILLRETTVGNG
jgi:hypothetical protein